MSTEEAASRSIGADAGGGGSLAFLKCYPQTGADTVGGRMLRHYWHPLCLSGDLKDLPYPVRMLGEDLVAFRSPDGQPGLLARRCPHRCASLVYGQVRPHGLQCSYHGWTFNAQGHCTAMPLERENSPMLSRVRQTWYPVREWGGVVWVYMGERKEDPPPLPLIDILGRDDGELIVERSDTRPYNYLNFMENFADMGHVYVLHMLAPGSAPSALAPYCDASVDIEWRRIQHHVFETDFGLKCVLVHDTANPEVKYVNTWSIALPTTFRFGGQSAGLPPDFNNDRREGGGMLRIIDDTHFEFFRFTLIRPGNVLEPLFPRANAKSRGLDAGLRGTVEHKAYDTREFPAWEGRPPVEDYVIQLSQGAIPPRELEHLGRSDIGVAKLRSIWRRSMAAVEAGEPPKQILTRDGVIETDTFKGLARADEIVLSPNNMPSSRDGRGLIRHPDGELVFA